MNILKFKTAPIWGISTILIGNNYILCICTNYPSYLDMAVVTCLAVIPPELGKDNFGFPAKILYVPAGSVEVYRKNAVWREAFETIAALP